MPLMLCPECQKKVSTYADACPKCGYPIDDDDVKTQEPARKESAGPGGVELVTIQQTSKAIKGNLLFAALCFWGGMFTLFGTAPAASVDGADMTVPVTALLVMVFGAVWWFITRIRKWWHHS